MVQVEAVFNKQLRARISGRVQHGGVDIDVISGRDRLDLVGDQVVELTDAVDDRKARRAGLDRYESEWDGTEGDREFSGKRAETGEYLFRTVTITEVVVASVEQQRARMNRRYQAVEKVIAGCERGAAEAEVEHARIEIVSERVPEAEGRASVEHGRASSIDGDSLKSANFVFKPFHLHSVTDELTGSAVAKVGLAMCEGR